MASKAVMDAIAARLAASWTATPVDTLNSVGDPPADGSPFLTVQYPIASEEQITVGAPGNNVFRESGVIRFVLSIQRGLGVDQGMSMVDMLRVLFRGKQFDGVTTWGASPPVLDDRNDSGNYWTLSLVVPYYFDLFA